MDLLNLLNIATLPDNSLIISGYRRDKDTGFSNASTYLLKITTDENNLVLANNFAQEGKLRDNLSGYDDVYGQLAIDGSGHIFATGLWWQQGVVAAPIVKYDQDGRRSSFDSADPSGPSIVYIDNWQHIKRFTYPLSSPSLKYEQSSHSLIYASLPDPRDGATDDILLFSINAETGLPNKSFGKSFNLADYNYAIGGPNPPDYFGVSVRGTTDLIPHTSTSRYPVPAGFSTTSLIEIQKISDNESRVVVFTTSRFGAEYDPVAIGYKLSDGQIDTTFGSNGICRLQFPVNGGSYLYDSFCSSTSDNSGNLFATGVCNSPIVGGGRNFYVAKIGVNGELDKSFAETGIAYLDIGGENKSIIAIDKTGNVIVATTSYGLGGNLHLTRICPDGKLDSNFGDNGSLFVTIPTATGSDPTSVEINDIKVLDNGNYVIAFTTGVASVVVLFDSSGNALSNYVEGGYVDNTIIATDATDFIIANEGADSISSGSGSDVVDGGNGDDSVDGGIGNDYLVGGAGDDFLGGGTGSDFLYSGEGNDIVDAGTGDDFIVGGDGAGDDTYRGGDGNDSIKYLSAKAGITINISKNIGIATSSNKKIVDASGIGNDKLYDIENIYAGNFSDKITGSSADNLINGEDGNDFIFSGGGDDILIGGLGSDYLDGGNGIDTADYSDCSDSINIILRIPSSKFLFTTSPWTNVFVDGKLEDKIRNIENLVGGSGDDTLQGNRLVNHLVGSDGNDTLNGNFGNDFLSGGTGSDRFVFNTMLDDKFNVDSIMDFAHGTDKIVLGRSIFSLSETLVNNNQPAQLVFDLGYLKTSSNTDGSFSLFYDKDGSSGLGAAIKFAEVTIVGVGNLDASDFIVT